MRIYRLIFLRELRKVFSYKANYIFSLMFYSSIIFLVSIGLQGQNSILPNVAPSLIWVSIILVLFLSFEDIFHDDYYDGTLDIYLIENITVYGFALFKSISCSKKLNDVSCDSVLKTPLSKKLTECPAGTVRPSG